MAPAYKVTYFNVKVLAEPIRFLLSYGNLDFEDERLEQEKWPSIKPNMPFGQVPVVEIEGKVAHQSIAIARYFAKKVKVYGDNDLEALQIDIMVDTINDLRTKIEVSLRRYQQDEIKEMKNEPLFTEIIPYYLDRLDAIAKDNNGYFANRKLSLADFYFVALLDYLNFITKMDLTDKHANLRKVRDNVLALPGIKAWVAKRPVTDV